MHRDRSLVVEGYSSLPVGVVLVRSLLQYRCGFGLDCPTEGLRQEVADVPPSGVWPAHGLQGGGFGVGVGHCGLFQDVYADVGFCENLSFAAVAEVVDSFQP